TEIGSETRFMAAGDWDGDQNVDLATAITLMEDSTVAPEVIGRASRLVIWWGQNDGHFTLSDTTRLSIGTPDWIYPDGGFSVDLDQNGVKDLMLINVWGWRNGEIFQEAPIQAWLS